MARSNDRDRSTKRQVKDKPGRRTKPKVCIFCSDRIDHVDYKDVALLRRFMSDRGKIRARQATGNCQQHQRDVAVAIKVARELILVPYSQRTLVTDRPGRAGARGRPGPPREEGRPAVTDEAGQPENYVDATEEIAGAEIAGEETAAEDAVLTGAS